MLKLLIKNYFKTNKMLFILFIVLQVVSILGIQYTYCTYKEAVNDRMIYVDEASTFTADFGDGLPFEHIKDKLSELTQEDIQSVYLILSSDGEIRTYKNGQHLVVNYGRNFNKDNEAVISRDVSLSKDVPLGDTLTVLGRQYKAVGLRSYTDFIELPYLSLENTDTVYCVKVRLSVLPSGREVIQITERLSQLFDEASIEAPKERAVSREYSFDASRAKSYLLFALSILNTMFAFRYAVTKRKNIYVASSLSGASAVRLSFIIGAEYFLYSLFSVILGTLISYTLMLPFLFKNLSGIKETVYPGAVFLLVCSVTLLPLLISFNRNNAISIKTKRE